MTSTTFFIIFIPILAILLLAINLILAPHNPYQEKDSVFECGFHSFLGQNRTQFSVSFFIFALLFLLFDLEILLVYPFSVSGYTNDIYGLVIMMVFFVLLSLGFVFELGKNALTIDSRQTSSYNTVDISEYYAFLSGFYIIYILGSISIGILLTIANNMLVVYPAPILDGLAYAVSLLLYSSDMLVAASSVPLSTEHKDLLKQADNFSDNRVREVPSINEFRYESADNKEIINDSVSKEQSRILQEHSQLESRLNAAIADNPSQSEDFEEKIHLINDAKAQALATLAETKATTLELIDDANSSLIFFIVGEGIIAEAVLTPFFVLVSVAVNLYSNKPLRYLFKVWFCSFLFGKKTGYISIALTLLMVSLVAGPTIISSVFTYIVSGLGYVNCDFLNTLEGFFTASFILNTNNKPSSEEDEIEFVDWQSSTELSGRYKRWRVKRYMCTGEKITHAEADLDGDKDELSVTDNPKIKKKLEENIEFKEWELGVLREKRAVELQQEAIFREQQISLKRKRELEDPVNDEPPKRHPSGWTPVNWPPADENISALITTCRFSVSSFIKNILANSRPVLNITMSLLFAALAVKYIIYIEILIEFFSVDYIRTAVSILLSVLFFSIKLLLMIRRANKSAALYNIFFKFLANHYVSGILYFSIFLLSVGLVYLCV